MGGQGNPTIFMSIVQACVSTWTLQYAFHQMVMNWKKVFWKVNCEEKRQLIHEFGRKTTSIEPRAEENKNGKQKTQKNKRQEILFASLFDASTPSPQFSGAGFHYKEG
jgi:hypothetical protein